MVVLREGDVYVLLLADLHAHDLILKAGDEGAGAEHQLMALRGAALKGHAVEQALIVDVGLVVQLGFAVGDFDIAGGAVAGALDVGHHIVVGDFLDLLLNGEMGILAELHVRAHKDFHGELELLALFDLLHIQFGAVDGLDVVLLQGDAVDVREDDVKSILVEHAGAIVVLDDLHRGLAAAEAGDIELLDIPLIRLADALVKFLTFYDEAQLYLVGRKFFKRGSHVPSSCLDLLFHIANDTVYQNRSLFSTLQRKIPPTRRFFAVTFG